MCFATRVGVYRGIYYLFCLDFITFDMKFQFFYGVAWNRYYKISLFYFEGILHEQLDYSFIILISHFSYKFWKIWSNLMLSTFKANYMNNLKRAQELWETVMKKHVRDTNMWLEYIRFLMWVFPFFCFSFKNLDLGFRSITKSKHNTYRNGGTVV